MYSQLFWEHVQQPRNRHALTAATNLGQSSYRRCGDKLQLYLKVIDGKISEASFEARACAQVIAVASVWTQEIIGLDIQHLGELSVLTLDQKLGGFPPTKRHAYLLFLDCLSKAISTDNTYQERD